MIATFEEDGETPVTYSARLEGYKKVGAVIWIGAVITYCPPAISGHPGER